MTEKLSWGILATGRIARIFAGDLSHSGTAGAVAVASRSAETASQFASALGIERAYGDYGSLLADETVDAVYIATPHSLHAEWAIKAAEAGKHVLCEKPIALNHAEAMAVAEAAREAGVFLMEAFAYRCHPQTARLVELIREGRIGEVRLIEARFGFDAPFDPASRIFSQALGGGGILDVGCYPLSVALLIAGAATGREFVEPVKVVGAASLNPVTGVDDWAIGSVELPGGIVAEIAASVRLHQESIVRVLGSEGRIEVGSPWLPGRDGRESTIRVFRNGSAAPEEIAFEPTPLYALEADVFAQGVATGAAPFPAMSVEESLANMRGLDEWRQSIGLVYEQETRDVPTVSRRPLARRDPHPMRYGRIGGIGKPVSRLVMGVDNQLALPHASAVFDHFFEHGGNAFDTAWTYFHGRCERIFGEWMRARGIRNEVVVVGKGAHTPFCEPRHITPQLEQSLERMKIDSVDLYLLHRDNHEVPVGEFVSVLAAHVRDGRIGAYGVSNWSIARLEEMIAFAREEGLPLPVCLSNNFSLALPVEVPWEGCVSAADAGSQEWLEKNRFTLLAWSSMARGFFAGAADPGDRSNAELVRCWYSEANFERLARARKLAEERGVAPINIALAYVLHRPYPSFALIGPRKLSETRVSLAALSIDLSDEELAWLNLQDAPARASGTGAG